MTLHWWMHWFWVTVLVALALISSPSAAPQSEELQHMSTELGPPKVTERQGRAMYYTKSGTPSSTPQTVSNISETHNTTEHANNTDVPDDIVHPAVHWTPANISDHNTTTLQLNVTLTDVNATLAPDPVTQTSKKRNNLTRLPEVKTINTNLEGAAESRIVTERPLSLETTYLQTRVPANIESSRRVVDSTEETGMDTGAIAGISFAALVLAALAGSTGFVLYRRRYLNKPQTLNDKCSNPDSSGYLDDSTIRDNSEEMYSLDNDSFLNSLEAMTIQNYWTDTVKHTKL